MAEQESKRLTVIAPVYNEEAVIVEFYERTKAVLCGLPASYTSRIMFVVDRCTDRTLEILRRIASNDRSVQVLALSSRFGHQMSLLAGIDAAKDADVLIMMDSDLQHPPELIPELLRQHESGHDIVNTIRTDTEGGSVLRRSAGRLFYRLLAYLSAIPVHIDAADFRLISQRVARLLRTEIRERNMFLRGLFSWIGFSQINIAYVAGRRAAGESKYSLSRMLSFAVAGVLAFSTKPLHLGIFVGIVLAAISFLIGLFTLGAYFWDNTIPSGWTTLVILLVLFSGVQLIFMGIIGAYIGGIYEEVKGRPHYIVDEAINV
jgi:polyisoprenyl-phosphate glycosyltransferase